MSQWMIQQVSRRMLHWQPLRNVKLIKESLEVYNIYLGCCEERRLCGRSWLCTGQWAPVKRHGKIMTIKRSGKYLSAMWTSLKSGFGTALGSVINLLWFKMSLSKRTKHLL